MKTKKEIEAARASKEARAGQEQGAIEFIYAAFLRRQVAEEQTAKIDSTKVDVGAAQRNANYVLGLMLRAASEISGYIRREALTHSHIFPANVATRAQGLFRSAASSIARPSNLRNPVVARLVGSTMNFFNQIPAALRRLRRDVGQVISSDINNPQKLKLAHVDLQPNGGPTPPGYRRLDATNVE